MRWHCCFLDFDGVNHTDNCGRTPFFRTGDFAATEYSQFYENQFSYCTSKKIEENAKCDFYLIAEVESENADYEKKLEIWEDAQRDYGSIFDYKGQIRCFERLHEVCGKIFEMDLKINFADIRI